MSLLTDFCSKHLRDRASGELRRKAGSHMAVGTLGKNEDT